MYRPTSSNSLILTYFRSSIAFPSTLWQLPSSNRSSAVVPGGSAVARVGTVVLLANRRLVALCMSCGYGR
jgi:hypothetical protein